MATQNISSGQRHMLLCENTTMNGDFGIDVTREVVRLTDGRDRIRWSGEGWYAFSEEWNDWRTLPVEMTGADWMYASAQPRCAYETARSMGYNTPPRYFTEADVR